MAGLLVAVPTALAIVLPQLHAGRVLDRATAREARVVEVRNWVVALDLSLRYEVDGRSYTVHRGSITDTPPLEVGDRFDVWVDPENPGWATAPLVDPVPAWMDLPILVGVVAGPIGVLAGGTAFCSALVAQLSTRWAALRRAAAPR